VIEELLVDPRSVPGAGYVAAVLAGLAALSLAGVLVGIAAGRGGADRPVLVRRWATWTVLATLFALACLSGPLSVALLVGVFALLGLREYADLVELPASHRSLLAAGSVVAGALALGGAAALLAMIPLLLIVGTLQPVVLGDVRQGMRHLAFGALGFGYLPLLLNHAVLIVRDVPDGGLVLFATGVAIAFSDIGAYVVGRTFGRHKLAPILSPAKTVEGLAGNLLGAILGFAILAPVLPAMPPALLVLLPVLVALAAVWGDLFESALKREFGTKDTGTWLPGFGGLLDRIDSFILVVPVVYYAFRVAGLAAA
jgi:phosphatidate cytidylyltransferase